MYSSQLPNVSERCLRWDVPCAFITADIGLHGSIILVHQGNPRAMYLRQNGGGQTQVTVAAPASLEIPMIISGAVIHCPNERTQPSRPLDLTPIKPSRLDRAGLKSTMYAGTGSRLRNVSAAKSNPLHLSLRAQVCAGEGPPLSQSSGRAKTFCTQWMLSIVRALQHPTVFASVETSAHAGKQRDVQPALPFVVGTQQPIPYMTARPILPWLPRAHPLRGFL
jgi:hypothetical protein